MVNLISHALLYENKIQNRKMIVIIKVRINKWNNVCEQMYQRKIF